MVKPINIRSTQITDDIRVSSGVWQTGAHFGEYSQVETWVFSDNATVQSDCEIHGTFSGHGECPDLYRARAEKFHDEKVKELKEKLNE